MKIGAVKLQNAFVVVWEFHVRPRRHHAFERAYGPEGEWVKLFADGAGYIRTDLIRDLNSPHRYLTLDYWQSRRHYEIFRKKHWEAYLTIDQKCSALTARESETGCFTIKRLHH
jgi:heme-degrading monooxygenase HmoA